MDMNGNKTARQLVMNLPDAIDDQSLAQDYASAMSQDLARKINASIVAALQKHITDLRLDNFSQYADRMTVVQDGPAPYPATYYLDKDIPICRIGKAETDFFGTKATLHQPITFY